MKKVPFELITHALRNAELETDLIAKITKDITELADSQEEEEKTPRVKKQFCILISDPENKLPDTDFTGWVVQIPEEDSPMVVEERITRAAYEFNQTPKGRRIPAKSIGEACEAVPARLLKEENIWVKTKEPVLVLRTDNKIPFEKVSINE